MTLAEGFGRVGIWFDTWNGARMYSNEADKRYNEASAGAYGAFFIYPMAEPDASKPKRERTVDGMDTQARRMRKGEGGRQMRDGFIARTVENPDPETVGRFRHS